MHTNLSIQTQGNKVTPLISLDFLTIKRVGEGLILVKALENILQEMSKKLDIFSRKCPYSKKMSWVAFSPFKLLVVGGMNI